jgi:putative peptide-modifying radical SAM enzyme
MHYHLLLTELCNKSCRYCGGFTHDNLQADISYDLEDLRSFMEKDPDASISFYGGEPTLKIPMMERIMDTVPAKRFQVQTNATYIDKVDPEYLSRLHTILISIDGTKETTDYYRGEGTYDLATRNARRIKEKGFKGDLVARMAMSERSDVHRDVGHLVDLGPFDNVHWQLDVFWTKEGWKDLTGWITRSYLPGTTKLVNEWVDAMGQGVVKGIVPFKALTGLMLKGRKANIWCGAGRDCFAITPRGEIMACPIDPSNDGFMVGNIKDKAPSDIRDFMTIGEPCTSCEVFGVCGGRCLYANKVDLWGRDRFDEVCGTVKHLIKELEGALPRVRALIKEGKIAQGSFDYPEGNNSCEIIP